MGVDVTRPLVSFEEARQLLDDAARPIERTARMPLAEAAGRVLASDVVATLDVPPFPRSAMDGYAVRAADTAGAREAAPVQLRVIDRAYAGRPASRSIEPGTAIAIATGAVIPDGADSVVMVEDTRVNRETVTIVRAATPGQHVTPRGSDFRSGAVLLARGMVLTAARLGVIAATGAAEADVYQRPVVSILSTGDEVVPPGAELAAGQIYDVNTTTLAAVVRAHGGSPRVHPHVGDDPDALARAFDACLDADVVLVSGGSSVGERDYVRDLLASRGVLVFEGIAVKPGKPTMLAMVNGRPVLGMPGNPTSCLSNAHLLVVPLLRRIARLPPFVARTVEARLSRRVTSPAGRHQFYSVRLDGDRAVPVFKGSGEITSMADADGYFEVPSHRESVDEGERVTVTLF